MRSSLLRWLLAAVFGAGLIAGLWFAAAGRFSLDPGRSARELVSSAGRTRARPQRGRAVEVTGSHSASGRTENVRSGGLGSRLIESGRPRGSLLPLAAENFGEPKTASESRAVPPARLDSPKAGAKEKRAVRERAVSAARETVGKDFTPKRRKIPPPAEHDARLGEALKVSPKVPRLSSDAGELPDLSAGAEPEKGKPVKPPASTGRLPAPVVPLP